MSEVLARRDRALTPEETEALLRDRLGAGITRSTVEFATFTVHVDPGHWHAVVQLCRDEPLLAYDMFDSLFGIDARDEGFDVVAVLYSTSTGNRLCLRTRCEGGREAPVCDTVTDVYRGADWMERETWDMFGIEFEGHPGLEPRLLTVENFEGWPLRKDFHLSSRVAKPWPGVKEPAELDEDGNVIERVPQIGDAPGPYDLDKAMAEQARSVNATAIDEAAEAANAGGAQQAPTSQDRDEDQAEEEPQVDQETYDRLIAEGKSERIARSKAKAALIKKQRAAAAEADQAGSEAAGDDDARPEDAGSAESDGDPAAEAAAKADERRKAQAEARAKKAADRADQDADDGGAAAEDRDDGAADAGGDAQNGGGDRADGGDGASQEDQA